MINWKLFLALKRVFKVLVAVTGLGFVVGLAIYLNHLLATRNTQTVSQPPQPSSQFLSTTPTTLVNRPDPMEKWRPVLMKSGATRDYHPDVSFKLPEFVELPKCDQSACYSQSTRLPGKTVFQVALRGNGEYLPYSWSEFQEQDLKKNGYTFSETTINGKEAITFSRDGPWSTHGGWVFDRLDGVVIQLKNGKFLEVNHFIPTEDKNLSDFESDDILFAQILTTFRFGVE